jgi:hypothetical protein
MKPCHRITIKRGKISRRFVVTEDQPVPRVGDSIMCDRAEWFVSKVQKTTYAAIVTFPKADIKEVAL